VDKKKPRVDKLPSKKKEEKFSTYQHPIILLISILKKKEKRKIMNI